MDNIMPPRKKKTSKDETYYVTVRATFTTTYSNKKGYIDKRESEELTFKVNNISQITSKAKKEFENFKQKRLESPYTEDIKNVRMIQKSRIKGQLKGKNALVKIRMKECGALMVDGWGTHEWDTNTGHCVYDYLIHTYKDVPGCKKICKNYETLDAVLSDFDNDNGLTKGVNCDMIKNFAVKAKLSMYCLNDDDEEIMYYKPTVKNSNKGANPIQFRIKNNHFYPIVDKSAHQLKMTHTKTHYSKDSKETEKKEYEIEVIETDDKDAKFIEICKDLNTQPLDRNIHYDGQVSNFVIGEKKYILLDSNEMDEHKLIKEKFDADSKLTHVVNSTMREIHPLKEKSRPNPKVNYELKKEGVKWRTHYGSTGVSIDSKGLKAFDINKCYRAEMLNPRDDWLMLGFNDCLEIYAGELKLGLFFVETNDYTILHGSNWYSNKILEYADEFGIQMNITHQILSTKKIEKDYLSQIIHGFIDKCGDSKDLAKLMINQISGFLGKDKSSRYNIKVNTDVEQVFNGMRELESEFLKKQDDYYIYGNQVVSDLPEHNIPMYIQILDGSNIRLHQMSQQIGGQVAFRKTDCVVMTNPVNDFDSDVVGEFSQCIMPKHMDTEMNTDRNVALPTKDVWRIVEGDIREAMIGNKGLLLEGRAGTGKTYTAKQIMKALNVRIAAPTHKAAHMIGGVTIHNLLNMDINHEIKQKTVNELKRDQPWIIIDEISMITAEIWRILCKLKDETGCPFLLIGDKRQCPPVELDGWDDYFDHPAVHYLARGLKCELTEMQRYDKELWDILEDIDNISLSKFGSKKNPINICYLNTTRKKVNAEWNQHKGLKLNALEDDEFTQDTWVYEGLPVITRETVKGLFYNQQRFTVSKVANGMVELGTIEIETDNFLKYFAMDYCTTVYKYQGDTIYDDFTIHDWNLMNKKLRYTALSRAKSVSQISIQLNPTKIKPTGCVEKRVQGYYHQDKEKNRFCNLTVDYVNELLKGQVCTHCHEVCLDSWSIDRKDDSLGHVMGNCVLSCLSCNHAKKK